MTGYALVSIVVTVRALSEVPFPVAALGVTVLAAVATRASLYARRLTRRTS